MLTDVWFYIAENVTSVEKSVYRSKIEGQGTKCNLHGVKLSKILVGQKSTMIYQNNNIYDEVRTNKSIKWLFLLFGEGQSEIAYFYKDSLLILVQLQVPYFSLGAVQNMI